MWSQRGAVSRATGTALGSDALGIHLHPSLLVERRDATRGTRLYLRDACDAGTVLAMVPRSAVINLETLRRSGTLPSSSSPSVSRFFQRLAETEPFVSTPSDPIHRLLGANRFGWSELVWRLAFERVAQSQSRWWSWIEDDTTQDEQSKQVQRQLEDQQELEFRLRFPELADVTRDSRQALTKAQSMFIEEIVKRNSSGGNDNNSDSFLPAVPNRTAVLWAFDKLLRKSILAPASLSSSTDDSAMIIPTIVPVIDLCSVAVDPTEANSTVSLMTDGDETIPSWLLDRLKAQIADAQKIDVNDTDESEDDPSSKSKHSRGPRKPLSKQEVLQRSMRDASRTSSRHSQRVNDGSSVTSRTRPAAPLRATNAKSRRRDRGFVAAQQELEQLTAAEQKQRREWFCLETTSPLMPGTELSLDWIALSSMDFVAATREQQMLSRRFYSWMRYRTF